VSLWQKGVDNLTALLNELADSEKGYPQRSPALEAMGPRE
jgi:hypothetical protein